MENTQGNFEKIFDFERKYIPKLDENTENLYHYTDASSFQSILFNKKENITLWATRYDCLSDVGEGDVYLQAYREVCREMLENKELDGDKYKRIMNLKATDKYFVAEKTNNDNKELAKNKVDDKTTQNALNSGSIRETLKTIGETKEDSTLPNAEDTNKEIVKEESDTIIAYGEAERYVCSFSKNSDLLSIWNYYSKDLVNTGYNIGFDVSKLTSKSELNNFKIQFHPVIYDKKEQKELIKNFLLGEISQLEANSIDLHLVEAQLRDFSLIFKSSHYKHEEECRIIVSIPKEPLEPAPKPTPKPKLEYYGFEDECKIVVNIPKEAGNQDAKKSPSAVQYRESAGCFVPYIELQIKKECFSDVTIGARTYNVSQKEIQKTLIGERLVRNGYISKNHCADKFDSVVRLSSATLRH